VTVASNKITGVTSPYTHTGRTNGTDYYYLVTAVNSAGESVESTEATVAAGVLLAGLFADANLQTCVDGLALTYAHEVTGTLTCNNLGIVNLSGIEYLTGFTTLDLGTNNIADLSLLSTLTNLTWLTLYENNISDVGPLTSLTNLTYLDLYKSGSIPDLNPLSTLTALAYLDLDFNSVINVSPLSTLINLTSLYLSSNNIVDVSPLATLIKLITFSAHDNSFGGQGVGNVDALITLTSANSIIIHNNITMSCAEANTLICGAGNAVSAGICTPASDGFGIKVNIEGGVGVLDEPIDGTNCTNP
jgi:Leucine-rich repeat (LRR) protein